MKKYKVLGGCIESKNDGDTHYISAMKLCLLYGVNPSECYLVDAHQRSELRRLPDDLIELRPRYDGHYFLPPENKEGM